MIIKPYIVAMSMLGIVLCLSPGLPGSQEQTDQVKLAAVLKKSAEYCRRLDRAALDFVCLEEVKETTRNVTPSTDVYLYDFQFVRKNEEAKENRTLVAVNGKKTKVRDSRLHAASFQYRNVLFGPIGLLSESWQAFYDYKLAGEETLQGEKALLVDATPKTTLPKPHPYGRIWIKADDGGVLKIVWDQRSLGNFNFAEDWAKNNDAEPQITAFSEYRFEKNGLRFPSWSYTEEAYILKDKKKHAGAEISILYKNYKFFTVETEIKYEPASW